MYKPLNSEQVVKNYMYNLARHLEGLQDTCNKCMNGMSLHIIGII